MTAYENILGLVAARTGLVFVPPRLDGAHAGIRRAMARAGETDAASYGALLAARADVLDDLLVELTVGETYFFRQSEQFAVIRNEILPEIRRRRGDRHAIHCWSAGCASGEEAYSLAIVMAEEEGTVRDAGRVYATDISRTVLAKARAAIYGEWSLRDEGAALARPYLRRRAGGYEVDADIRRRVMIEYGNLASDHYPSLPTGVWRMDLIVCRNVLIYFDRATIGEVARRLFAALAEGGWLVTGPSDPLLGADAPFESIVTSAGIVYRRPLPALPVIDVAAAAQKDEVCRPHTASVATPSAAAHEAASTPPPCGVAESVAAAAAAAAVVRHPLDAGLQYLHAALLIDGGHDDDAMHVLRRILYLDRSLAAVHFALGAVLRRLGDLVGARRAYRNARDLSAATPPEAVLPFTDGELAGSMVAAADGELAVLVAAEERP
jgi:chemotaxis protein methyltransferase CheR